MICVSWQEATTASGGCHWCLSRVTVPPDSGGRTDVTVIMVTSRLGNDLWDIATCSLAVGME